MPRPPRTRPVSAAQVRSYSAKAEEFVAAAASALGEGRNIAATSLAIHADINSADAVWGARLGQRAAAEDHEQVLVLLRQAGPDGAEVERDLRRLLPLKTKAESDPDDIAPAVAARAVERAQRCAAVAQKVTAPAGERRTPPSVGDALHRDARGVRCCPSRAHELTPSPAVSLYRVFRVIRNTAILGTRASMPAVGARPVELVQQCDIDGVGVDPVEIHIDRAMAAVEAAGLADRVTFHRGVMHDLAYEGGHFDFVWCRDVVKQVDDLDGTSTELVRVMKPGGRLLAYTTITTELLDDRDAEMIRRHLGTSTATSIDPIWRQRSGGQVW